MLSTIRCVAAASTLFALAACEEPGIPTLAKVGTDPLPDGQITIDGTDYTLKRAIPRAGRKKGEEVWAIVYQGKAYSCTSATEIGCEFALTRARNKERQERDMGY